MQTKYFLIIFFLLIAIPLDVYSDARPDGQNTLYFCNDQTGGVTFVDLDALKITATGSPNEYDLVDGDKAIVIESTGVTFYIFDADATDAESDPDYIRPDDYSTAGVWDRIAIQLESDVSLLVDECKDQTFEVFGSSDATPDVSNGDTGVYPCWQVHQSTSPTITDFDDGDDHSEFTQGDKFLLLVDYTPVIDFSDNSNIEGNSNVDFTGSASQIVWLIFQFDGTRWVERLLPGKSSPNVLSIKSIQINTLEISELNDTSDPYLFITSELLMHYISNSESTGADEWDFPAMAEGWDFCFVKEANYDVTLDPNGSEQWYFRIDNAAYTQLSAGEAIENTTSGRSTICCFSTENAVYCTGDENWDEETP